jgi:hypothetical protein
MQTLTRWFISLVALLISLPVMAQSTTGLQAGVAYATGNFAVTYTLTKLNAFSTDVPSVTFNHTILQWYDVARPTKTNLSDSNQSVWVQAGDTNTIANPVSPPVMRQGSGMHLDVTPDLYVDSSSGNATGSAAVRYDSAAGNLANIFLVSNAFLDIPGVGSTPNPAWSTFAISQLSDSFVLSPQTSISFSIAPRASMVISGFRSVSTLRGNGIPFEAAYSFTTMSTKVGPVMPDGRYALTESAASNSIASTDTAAFDESGTFLVKSVAGVFTNNTASPVRGAFLISVQQSASFFRNN